MNTIVFLIANCFSPTRLISSFDFARRATSSKSSHYLLKQFQTNEQLLIREREEKNEFVRVFGTKRGAASDPRRIESVSSSAAFYLAFSHRIINERPRAQDR